MTDSSWLIEAAKQVPALTILVVVVIAFLKYMAEDRKAADAIRTEEAKAIAKISDTARDFQKELTAENQTIMVKLGAIIEKNTLQMGRSVYAFEQLIASQRIKDFPTRQGEQS